MTQANIFPVDVPPNLGQNWGWFLTFGMCLGALGILGVAYSVTATVSSMYFYGGMLVAAAAIECANAVMVGRWSGFFLHLVGALLFGVTGLLLLKYPVRGAESIAALMGAFFIVGGLFEVIAPLFVSLPGRGWHVLNGATAATFGILVLAQWPFSGLRAIGTFISIDLLLRGLTWTVFAIGLGVTSHVNASETRPNLGRY